jgi:hypothetical protein
MVARESSQPRMEAWESSHVTGRAGKFTLAGLLVHGHAVAKIPGAVLLRSEDDITTLDDWIDYYGLEQARGWVTVFKLVNDDFRSGQGTLYEVGTEVGCPDWSPKPQCGEGLHFSPHPTLANRYAEGTRYLLCKVKRTEVVLLGDKLNAKRCKVVCEVDQDGQPVATIAQAA